MWRQLSSMQYLCLCLKSAILHGSFIMSPTITAISFFLVASLKSSNIRGSLGCNFRYPHKRTTRLLNSADLGGHRISQKRKTTFLEKICVVQEHAQNRLLIPPLQAQLLPI